MRHLMSLVENSLNELRSHRGNDDFKAFMAASSKGKARTSVMAGFLKHLEERGYTPLGSGEFSMVFTHPGINYAVKVFKNDPAYIRFIRLCLAHQDNEHFPRFRGKLMRIDGGHYCIRMELLEPLPYSLGNQASSVINRYVDSRKTLIDFEPADLAAIKATLNDLQNQLVSANLNRESTSTIKSQMRRAEYDIERQERLISDVAFYHANRSLFEAVDLILQISRHFDMHTGNILQRDGTIVIIDPVADMETIE